MYTKNDRISGSGRTSTISPLGMLLKSCYLLLILLSLLPSQAMSQLKAVIVTDNTTLAAPVRNGIEKLKEQLAFKGYNIKTTNSLTGSKGDVYFIAGLSSTNGEAAKQLHALKKQLPVGFEALSIQKTTRQGSPEVILCGSDANGLMYALLDVAQRIGLVNNNSGMLSLIGNEYQKADIKERSISTYTMQKAYFEQRLYDEDYWKAYFDQLAQSRFNNFLIIFGYENGGFLAPAYPFFFNTDGFPNVKMIGLTQADQQKNRKAFTLLIDLAHERGIKITVGIWDHIFRGGVQNGGVVFDKDHADTPVPDLVWGVNSDNLVAYTMKSIAQFLQVFPGIDGIQFRMHPESGLTEKEMPGFWHDAFKMIVEKRPDLLIDIRAKELPDEIIKDAISQGVKIQVDTKYWMEQMGLPFHPTHVNREDMMNRRHGYADLLQFPQQYKVMWRLWNGGTSRILLWGDPEYAKRFAQSTHLYNGNSAGINEPLSTKMEAQPQEEKPFDLLNKPYQSYKYEFQRYWYFFDVFGRMLYNNTIMPERLWEAEFSQHFGRRVGPLLKQGLQVASKVLPMIVASSYNYSEFPTTRGWAEKMHFGDLAKFSKGGGTDIQQFVSFQEEAQDIIDGTDDPRTSVFQTSKYFATIADSVLRYSKLAEQAAGTNKSKEFIVTNTDLKILANLALYYSHRVIAAVNYNLFLKTNNLCALDKAIDCEKSAIASWQDIVTAAGDVYAKDLLMGVCGMNMCGDWQTDLTQLHEEFQNLNEMRSKLLQKPGDGEIKINHIPVRHLIPGKKLVISANINSNHVKSVRCAIKVGNGPYSFTNMAADGQWRYQVQISIPSTASSVYYYIEAFDDKGEATSFPQGGSKNPVSVLVTNDVTGPIASITRIDSAAIEKPLTVAATVKDPSGVKWVKLRYRHVTQYEDYETVDMQLDKRTGKYTAVIPGSFIIPKWNIMYFVETMDKAGNGSQYPDLSVEAPYVMVRLIR
ncbi:MAG TPA: hypothetical protein VIJ75_14395 [Hanamia sp.]